MQTTNVALIGCGRWGSNCLRDLKVLGCDVTVVAVSDDSRGRAAEGGASRVVASAGELRDIQGVVIASPTDTHADVVESVLDLNVPIFVEKPLTNDLGRARSLSQRAPDRLFVMDKWRYHPGIERLRDIAANEELGPVIGLHTRRLQWNTNHVDVDGVWILAPHDLVIGMEILGHLPEPRSAVGEWSGGKAHSLTAILGDSPWHAMEVSARHPQYVRDIRLLCRDGIALLDDGYAQNLRIWRSTVPESTTAPEPELIPFSTEFPLLRELRAFVEHLNGGPAPRTSAAESVHLIESLVRLRCLAGLEREPVAV
jgi:predicted dehydrogenase